MNYQEFFTKFYLGNKKSSLKEWASKWQIPSFFFSSAIDEDKKNTIPTDTTTFLKYINGKSEPNSSLCNAVLNSRSEALLQALLTHINPYYLDELLLNFGIRPEIAEGNRLERFAYAVSRQFYELAAGFGTANDRMQEYYHSWDPAYTAAPPSTDTETSYAEDGTQGEIRLAATKQPYTSVMTAYLDRAKTKYSRMYIWGEEFELFTHYVGCRIGLRRGVFTEHSEKSGIENPTLDRILGFDPNGHTRHTKIIGGGGMGKSLLLHYLFLESAKKFSDTWILPILVELNEFDESTKDLTQLVLDAIYDDPEEAAKDTIIQQYLKQGRCQVLFDGVDEIDISLANQFENCIKDFREKYSLTQIVLTSRECELINKINGFSAFHMQPFDNRKTEELILKLLPDEEKEATKNKILEYLGRGFIQKDGKVATNPMILSYLVFHHNKIEKDYQQRAKFYRAIYDALLTGHDEQKETFHRIFLSVDSPEDYTKVFREFCAKTFLAGETRFDNGTFEEYFNDLHTIQTLDNIKKCTLKAFQHDCCACACMMYEEDEDYYYIDEAFQEFLFAEYYRYGASEKEAEDLVEILNDQSLEDYQTLDAFELLYDDSPDKTAKNILRPFLRSIFWNKTPEEAFLAYLNKGYSSLQFSCLSSELLEAQREKIVKGTTSRLHHDNESYNILFRLIQELNEIPFVLKLILHEPIDYPNLIKGRIIGEQLTLDGKEGLLVFRRIPVSSIPSGVNPICDEAGKPVIYGFEYEISTDELIADPQKYAALIRTLMQPEYGLYPAFQKTEEFYKETGKRIRKEHLK